MKIGNREFKAEGHTYVCGILNITPDSFSDGGKFKKADNALFHVEKMIKDGAELIDVGGQSTRPGYLEITEGEEIERVVPIIKKIRDNFDIPISIDTYKSAVAAAAIEEGAGLINDIWGLKGDTYLAGLAAEKGVPVCIMHNRKNTDYGDFMEDLKSDLMESVSTALRAGIKKENIILDPGIGFAKSFEQNLFVLNNLSLLKEMGYPLLLGTSRKSVIGMALKQEEHNKGYKEKTKEEHKREYKEEHKGKALMLPVSEREEGTLVTTVLAVQAGYNFVRVHDVEKNVRAVRMMEAVRDIEKGVV